MGQVQQKLDALAQKVLGYTETVLSTNRDHGTILTFLQLTQELENVSEKEGPFGHNLKAPLDHETFRKINFSVCFRYSNAVEHTSLEEVMSLKPIDKYLFYRSLSNWMDRFTIPLHDLELTTIELFELAPHLSYVYYDGNKMEQKLPEGMRNSFLAGLAFVEKLIIRNSTNISFSTHDKSFLKELDIDDPSYNCPIPIDKFKMMLNPHLDFTKPYIFISYLHYFREMRRKEDLPCIGINKKLLSLSDRQLTIIINNFNHFTSVRKQRIDLDLMLCPVEDLLYGMGDEILGLQALRDGRMNGYVPIFCDSRVGRVWIEYNFFEFINNLIFLKIEFRNVQFIAGQFVKNHERLSECEWRIFRDFLRLPLTQNPYDIKHESGEARKAIFKAEPLVLVEFY
ncbi:MAG: hypothetical protein ACK5MA_06765, partial [Parachlamydiaceae bacterium]